MKEEDRLAELFKVGVCTSSEALCLARLPLPLAHVTSTCLPACLAALRVVPHPPPPQTMAVYYDVWKPPRGDQQSRMIYMRKDIIPKISFDNLRLSLELRCFQDKNLGKQAMMEVLYKVRRLEYLAS